MWIILIIVCVIAGLLVAVRGNIFDTPEDSTCLA